MDASLPDNVVGPFDESLANRKKNLFNLQEVSFNGIGHPSFSAFSFSHQVEYGHMTELDQPS